MFDFKILRIILIILYFFVFVNNSEYFLSSIEAIFIHEFSHIFYLKLNGIKDILVNFYVFGFKMNLKDCLSNNKMLLLYLVGSLSNILIAIFLYIIGIVYNVNLFENFMKANFIIGLINLIPAIPLDGANIIKNLLSRKFRDIYVQKVIIYISFFISVLFLVIGVYLSLFFKSLNLSYIMISIIILINTFLEYKEIIDNGRLRKELLDFKDSFKSKIGIISTNYNLNQVIDLYIYNGIEKFYIFNDEYEFVVSVNIKEILDIYSYYGNVDLKTFLNK